MSEKIEVEEKAYLSMCGRNDTELKHHDEQMPQQSHIWCHNG